jgi:hypothetical protein
MRASLGKDFLFWEGFFLQKRNKAKKEIGRAWLRASWQRAVQSEPFAMSLLQRSKMLSEFEPGPVNC